VERKINQLFEFLTPPVQTDELKEQLESLKSSVKNDIRTTIVTHLNTQSDINTKKLAESTFKKNDMVAARELAEKVILKKYGRKASRQNLNAWLAADLSAMGQETTAPTTVTNHTDTPPKPSTHTNNDETAASLATNNTCWETPQTSRKRRRDSPATTVPVSNRFSALTDETEGSEVLTEADTATNPKKLLARSPIMNNNNNMNNNRNDNTDTNNISIVANININEDKADAEIDDAETWSMTSSQCDHLLASQPSISSTRSSLPNPYVNLSTHSNVTVYDSNNKRQWRLHIKNSPNTVIIADSNFRLAKDIPLPDDWEVHVYPGNNFLHTTNLLKTATIPNCVKNIVLAVGINNKGWNFTISSKPDWNKMLSEAKKVKPAVHFLGVSTVNPSESIKTINQEGKKNFGAKFITALPEDQVTVSPSDPFKIHHDRVTVEKIINSIKIHLN
jgi:hypothetical protein